MSIKQITMRFVYWSLVRMMQNKFSVNLTDEKKKKILLDL